jgi:hypothetical protein
MDMADEYSEAYSGILRRIVGGRLVHVDETKVKIGGEDNYVWVFTSLKDVAYVYSKTREATTLHDVLDGFQGVLVSDFYAGYDSMPCAQQKCLIHLLRDINDDVLKHPFNEEMQWMARSFADLMRPIVETINRFGLKLRHLSKHKEAAEKFLSSISRRDFVYDVCQGYKKRFEKGHDTLFTFLDYDGVPWNNNNAEHAIKAFAEIRNVIGNKSSPKGLPQYLTLLSVCETCKCREVSFLKFLLSEYADIEDFCAHAPRTRRDERRV